jgi:hypothetical protein
LHRPSIAIGIGETEERATILLTEAGDLAGLNAAADQLLPCRVRVGDDELETLHRAGLHRVHSRSVAKHDGAAGAGRCQLGHVHLRSGRVVVECEPNFVAVEGDRGFDVANWEYHDLQCPIHDHILVVC